MPVHRLSKHRQVYHGGHAENEKARSCGMSNHLEDHVIPPSRQREKPRSNLKWIGKDMKRVEDPRLLTGKGKYIDDIELPNMAHAAVLGSPHAHAHVKAIDVSKAQELPGVILVFT